jgi:hypothetical protein
MIVPNGVIEDIRSEEVDDQDLDKAAREFAGKF